MARPRSDDRRTEKLEARVTPAQKAQVAERAIAAGQKMGEYIRDRALGLKANGIPEGRGTVKALKARPPRSTPQDIEREEIAAEVGEAALVDGDAREAFVARRTRQLFGEGFTSLLAARKAAEEWDARGA